MSDVNDRDDRRNDPGAPSAGTDLCAVTDIEDGGARVFRFGNGWPGREIVVVRSGERVRAYANVCPHLPLPLNIGERVRTADQLLLCDHHYAVFRFSDGYCVDGACRGSSLDAVPLRVSGGRVAVG